MTGHRIQEVRMALGLSREDLAERLGLSYWAIAKYESGQRVPSVDVLISIADALGVSIDYLVGRTSDPHAHSSSNERLTPYTNGVETEPGGLQKRNIRSYEDRPDWLKNLPSEMQQFMKEESQQGWAYLRLARGLKMQNLNEQELRSIIDACMKSKG